MTDSCTIVQATAPVQAQGWQPLGSAERSLRANFSWALAGNLVFAVCQWVTLIVFAKLGSAQMVGQFAVASALTAPILLLVNLQLRAVEATDARDAYRFGDYLGLRLITTALALGAIGLLASAWRPGVLVVILAVGAAKAVDSLSDILYGLFQRHERMDYVGRSMMIRGLLALAAAGGVLALTGRLGWAALAVGAAWLAVLLAHDFPNVLRVLTSWSCVRPRFEAGVLASLVRLSLPLGIVMLLLSLQANVPFYLIENRLGECEVGMFAALWYLMAIGGQVTAALGQSASPRFARYHAEGDRTAFGRLLTQLIRVGVLLGAAGVIVSLAVGREILALVYRPEYAAHADAFLILTLAAAVSYVGDGLGYAATASRRIRLQPAIHLVLLGVALGSGWALVGYGLKGMAVSVLLTRLAGVVSFAILLGIGQEEVPAHEPPGALEEEGDSPIFAARKLGQSPQENWDRSRLGSRMVGKE